MGYHFMCVIVLDISGRMWHNENWIALHNASF